MNKKGVQTKTLNSFTSNYREIALGSSIPIPIDKAFGQPITNGKDKLIYS